jgi:hypothetical protein
MESRGGGKAQGVADPPPPKKKKKRRVSRKFSPASARSTNMWGTVWTELAKFGHWGLRSYFFDTSDSTKFVIPTLN